MAQIVVVIADDRMATLAAAAAPELVPTTLFDVDGNEIPLVGIELLASRMVAGETLSAADRLTLVTAWTTEQLHTLYEDAVAETAGEAARAAVTW